MPSFLKRPSPEFFLRLGLAGTYLYSGYDLFAHPSGWRWAVQSLPALVQAPIKAVGVETYLRFQGASELLFALIFLLWFLPKKLAAAAAFLAALEMAGIALLVGINGETFRDIGLLGAALALFTFTGGGRAQSTAEN